MSDAKLYIPRNIRKRIDAKQTFPGHVLPALNALCKALPPDRPNRFPILFTAFRL